MLLEFASQLHYFSGQLMLTFTYFIQGCNVQVHTVDGHIYDGVLDAVSPNVSRVMSLRRATDVD